MSRFETEIKKVTLYIRLETCNNQLKVLTYKENRKARNRKLVEKKYLEEQLGK